VIGFEEAIRRLTAIARPLGVETVALDEAWGRTLAKAVTAPRTAPGEPTSAMDGYAVRDADVAGGARRLRVSGESFAGGTSALAALEPGACMRIFTGAALPPGADRVVIQETVRCDGDAIVLAEPPAPARHVRAAGSDFRAGETLLEAGTLLTPQALVAAAAADRATLAVYARPRVAILATGDELRAPGAGWDSAGRIPESVSFGVAALAQAWGGEIVGRARLRDDLSVLVQAAGWALDSADVVVVTGGASVGARDFAKAMFAPYGLRFVFEKVAIKPGKPIWVGQAGGRIVVGLPGNPSAAMVTARLFLAPLLAGLGGQPPRSALAWRAEPLAAPLAACGEREWFHRARGGPDGVAPVADQDSSAQKTLAAADRLIRRRPDARAPRVGDRVEVLTF
jgi:molybdopterin molybdotransferase